MRRQARRQRRKYRHVVLYRQPRDDARQNVRAHPRRKHRCTPLYPAGLRIGRGSDFSEEPLDAPAGDVVYVENTRAALQKVAEHYRERFNIPVIGITGSVGKTTTKEMVALAVSAGLKTMKTAGNANSQIGLPMTVLRITPEDEAAIVEMGVSMPVRWRASQKSQSRTSPS